MRERERERERERPTHPHTDAQRHTETHRQLLSCSDTEHVDDGLNRLASRLPAVDGKSSTKSLPRDEVVCASPAIHNTQHILHM